MSGPSLAPAPTTAPEVVPTRRRLVLLLAVYLVLLVWAVLWKLEAPWVGEAGWRIVKLVPFVATSGAGASTPFDVVVNVALFVPFGVYLGLLAPSWPRWKAAGTVAVASVALEVAQYALAVGSTDLTDVVVNTAGGVVGLGFVALAHRRLGERAVAVLTRLCTIGTVLAVLAAALVVLSPLRYSGPEDVRCDPTSAAPCGPPVAPRDPGHDRVSISGRRVDVDGTDPRSSQGWDIAAPERS